VIARLQQIQLATNEINIKSKELASVYEVSLEPFSPLIYNLMEQFSLEFERYRLDEIVVAAIAPLVSIHYLLLPEDIEEMCSGQVRRLVANWDPLEEPTAFISTFRSWRRALRVSSDEEKPLQTQVDVYGSKTTIMTPVDM
jgi:tuftelin-interacting protein 11